LKPKKQYNVKMIYYPETEECEIQFFNKAIQSPDEDIDRQPVEPEDEEGNPKVNPYLWYITFSTQFFKRNYLQSLRFLV